MSDYKKNIDYKNNMFLQLMLSGVIILTGAMSNPCKFPWVIKLCSMSLMTLFISYFFYSITLISYEHEFYEKINKVVNILAAIFLFVALFGLAFI